MDGTRLRTLEQSLPFAAWYATSPHSGARAADGDVDLLFGNPHDMPMPGVRRGAQRHAVPQDPAWFAYMFNQPEATQTVAARPARAHRPACEPDDIA